MLSGFRSESSIKSEFLAMFSVNHNTSTHSKDNDGVVDMDEFIQYHQLISPLVERDCEWRNMLVGVWNMDIVPVDNRVAGSHPQVYGKNSREQWKLANHRSLFGEKYDDSILKHKVEPQNQRDTNKKTFVHGDMPSAGGFKQPPHGKVSTVKKDSLRKPDYPDA